MRRKSNTSPKTVELDIREDLRNKKEPFEKIMKAVRSLERDDTFILHATFKPKPLIGLLRSKGFKSETEQLGPDHWVVTFVHKKKAASSMEGTSSSHRQPAPSDRESSRVWELDNRGLEPPQPMVRTLSTLERMKDNDTLIIHNDRVPVFLLEELDGIGYDYRVEEAEDGSAWVTIRKK